MKRVNRIQEVEQTGGGIMQEKNANTSGEEDGKYSQFQPKYWRNSCLNLVQVLSPTNSYVYIYTKNGTEYMQKTHAHMKRISNATQENHYYQGSNPWPSVCNRSFTLYQRIAYHIYYICPRIGIRRPHFDVKVIGIAQSQKVISSHPWLGSMAVLRDGFMWALPQRANQRIGQ